MAILKAKNASEPDQPAGGLSIVAVGMTVRGDIESNGTVKVEGTVAGQPRTNKEMGREKSREKEEEREKSSVTAV
jgi:cytoskeletal protein CcmA (bactofilin family)